MAGGESCIVVGVGPGLGAAIGRRFAKAGYPVALAARRVERLTHFVEEIEAAGGKAKAYGCDARDEADMIGLFEQAEAELGPARIAVYNASGRVRKPIAEIGADEFVEAWKRACYGGFLLGREAAKRMVPRAEGSILFTGATASVKAFPGSAGFAVGKYGLRALAESMARELHPKNIHVAHFVIDGGIGVDDKQGKLEPDAIAEVYYQTHTQHRSTWSWEVAVRPWVETF